MSLAAVLGIGRPELTNLYGVGRKLDPDHVALIGVRSLDRGERETLRQLGVHVFTMSDIDRYGAHSVMKRALANVTQRTDYLHVSFDLDVVEPAVAPGVGTPVKGGLDHRESHLIMELIADSRAMTSLVVVEVKPVLDTKNASAEFAVELVQSAFGKRIL